MSESTVRLAQVMSDHDTNLYGTIHGGVIMKFIDDAAAAVAARWAETQAVTVSADLRFTAPARVGDLVEVVAEVTRVGRTSMVITTVVTGSSSHRTEVAREIASGSLVFVAIDQDSRPVVIPRAR